MSLAQQLCDEIVEPALTTAPSGEEHVKQSKPTKKNHGHAIYSNSKPVNKVCRSVVIEKKKVINKVLPKNSTRAESVINQYRSKEVVTKKFNDTAINTLVSGPLKCDTDCVTIVRRRDSYGYGTSCKCGVQKRCPSKLIAKEIQTQEFKQYGFSDKACSHIIQTVSCGTQFLTATTNESNKQSLHNVGNTNSLSVNPSSYPKKSKEKPYYKDLYHSNPDRSYEKPMQSANSLTVNPSSYPNKSKEEPYYMDLYHSNPDRTYEKPMQSATTSPSVRRWALSKYPVRGPDF